MEGAVKFLQSIGFVTFPILAFFGALQAREILRIRRRSPPAGVENSFPAVVPLPHLVRKRTVVLRRRADEVCPGITNPHIVGPFFHVVAKVIISINVDRDKDMIAITTQGENGGPDSGIASMNIPESQEAIG